MHLYAFCWLLLELQSSKKPQESRRSQEGNEWFIWYLEQNTIQNIHFLKDFAGIFIPGPATEDFEVTNLFLGFYFTSYLCMTA